MEYTLWVNRYFLTKVKATSMNEAIRSIKNMTSDENMFEWISVFDTPYEEGDIPILDLELYCYDKFISYDTLHDIINEYDYCYTVCQKQLEKIEFYDYQIKLGNNDYKELMDVADNIIDDMQKHMEKIYWMLREKR